MAFDQSEVVDNRARAQQLSQLIKWEDEGAIVKRWAENCLNAKDGREPSRLVLGRYLKERWSRELERQNGFKQSQPTSTASNWQPSGPDVLAENVPLCYLYPSV
jgi:hypothetical protein